MGLDHVRSEIEHMRAQVGRQRKEILQLQRAGIGTTSAELLLQRMLAKIEDLCDERDRLKKEQGSPMKGRVLGGRSWWWLSRSSGTTRTREGHCYQHVQAITIAIDQYAERALGNRDYFLNKPYSI
jgi:hypothetical protein